MDDEQLAAELRSADVCLCLRWPTARETSASWLRCLAAGKPTVVPDQLSIVDVPDARPATLAAQARPFGRRGRVPAAETRRAPSLSRSNWATKKPCSVRPCVVSSPTPTCAVRSASVPGSGGRRTTPSPACSRDYLRVLEWAAGSAAPRLARGRAAASTSRSGGDGPCALRRPSGWKLIFFGEDGYRVPGTGYGCRVCAGCRVLPSWYPAS